MRTLSPYSVRVAPIVSCCAWVVVQLIVMCSSSQAQTAEFTQNTSGTNSVTLEIPLANYPGRGVNMPVTLNYSSKGLWRIGFIKSVHVNIWGYQVPRSVTEAIYAEHSVAGWTNTLEIPKIEWPKQNDVYWFNGKPYARGTIYPYTFRIASMFLHMPDGSTHELRKADQVYQDTGYVDKVGTFYAVDGSRMRYDSTSESTGVLFLSDGTRYILNNGSAQYVDANGNTLSYDGTTRQWTDTLGRVIGLPWPANPGPEDYSYVVPGMSGSTLTYVLKFRNLSAALTPNAQGQYPAQKAMADYYLPDPYSPPTQEGTSNFPQPTQGASLFASDYSDPDASEVSYT